MLLKQKIRLSADVSIELGSNWGGEVDSVAGNFNRKTFQTFDSANIDQIHFEDILANGNWPIASNINNKKLSNLSMI